VVTHQLQVERRTRKVRRPNVCFHCARFSFLNRLAGNNVSKTRLIAERLRDALCQLEYCQLPHRCRPYEKSLGSRCHFLYYMQQTYCLSAYTYASGALATSKSAFCMTVSCSMCLFFAVLRTPLKGVCVSGRTSQKPHNQTSQTFLCTLLPVAVARSSSDDNAICYVLPFSWMT